MNLFKLHTHPEELIGYNIPYEIHNEMSSAWYLNGNLHREDGPAIIWADGTKIWYKNGLRHREDGPAVDTVYGNQQWFINGEEYSKSLFDKMINK